MLLGKFANRVNWLCYWEEVKAIATADNRACQE
jgi:hypothetical protein